VLLSYFVAVVARFLRGMNVDDQADTLVPLPLSHLMNPEEPAQPEPGMSAYVYLSAGRLQSMRHIPCAVVYSKAAQQTWSKLLAHLSPDFHIIFLHDQGELVRLYTSIYLL
jgi:hypothetical protein